MLRHNPIASFLAASNGVHQARRKSSSAEDVAPEFKARFRLPRSLETLNQFHPHSPSDFIEGDRVEIFALDYETGKWLPRHGEFGILGSFNERSDTFTIRQDSGRPGDPYKTFSVSRIHVRHTTEFEEEGVGIHSFPQGTYVSADARGAPSDLVGKPARVEKSHIGNSRADSKLDLSVQLEDQTVHFQSSLDHVYTGNQAANLVRIWLDCEGWNDHYEVARGGAFGKYWALSGNAQQGFLVSFKGHKGRQEQRLVVGYFRQNELVVADESTQIHDLAQSSRLQIMRESLTSRQIEWLTINAQEVLCEASNEVFALEPVAFQAHFYKDNDWRFWVAADEARAPKRADIVAVRGCLAIVVKSERTKNDLYADIRVEYIDRLPAPRIVQRFNKNQQVVIPIVILHHGHTAYVRMRYTLQFETRAPPSLRNAVSGDFHRNRPRGGKEYCRLLQEESGFLKSLRPDQREVADRACKSMVSVIQGPPGTGKTHTLAALVLHMADVAKRAKQHDDVHKPLPGQSQRHNVILAVADSNAATDQLYNQICRQAKGSWLEGAIHRFTPPGVNLEVAHRNLTTAPCPLHKAFVVVSTATSAAHDHLTTTRGWRFAAVVVDEATQSMEISSAIPAVRAGEAANNIILCGDHCQLEFIVHSGMEAYSFYDRLRNHGFQPDMLAVQTRMHPAIAAFPSKTFYEGNLVTQDPSDTWDSRFPLPSFISKFAESSVHYKGRVLFVNTDAHDLPTEFECTQEEKRVRSYVNVGEADLIMAALRKLCRYSPHAQVKVIAAYSAQRILLRSRKAAEEELHSDAIGNSDAALFWHRVQIDSIDSAQGSEAEIVLVSTTRSNDRNVMGFVDHAKRMNVALTRAKALVMVFGSSSAMIFSHYWADWLYGAADWFPAEQLVWTQVDDDACDQQ